LTGLIVAKSSITSPIQEALTIALKITENHNGGVAMHQLFTSTQKNMALQAVDKKLRKSCYFYDAMHYLTLSP